MGVALAAFIVAGVAAILGLQFWMQRKARRQEGAAVPAGLVPASGRALIYCHSPTCGPCRSMTPIVDRLAAACGDRVRKLDVGQDLSSARALGVMGTPTFVLVEEGVVARVILGPAREPVLRDWLG